MPEKPASPKATCPRAVHLRCTEPRGAQRGGEVRQELCGRGGAGAQHAAAPQAAERLLRTASATGLGIQTTFGGNTLRMGRPTGHDPRTLQWGTPTNSSRGPMVAQKQSRPSGGFYLDPGSLAGPRKWGWITSLY